MFGLFKKNADAPIPDEERAWIDKCFRWFIQEFGEDIIKDRPVFTPTHEDFPIDFRGSQDDAFDLLDLVAERMDLVPDDIDIDFYAEGEQEIVTGAGSYSRVFLRPAEDETTTAGHYKGKDEDGCYRIGLNSRSLYDVQSVISTIAHELAHIKLLGEERIPKNNEPLTDLTTIIFGLGIFGANSCATFRTGAYSWSHGRKGYLTQMDWGYGLALHAHFRGETSPTWLKHLNLNVKGDFKQAMRFIEANPDKVLVA